MNWIDATYTGKMPLWRVFWLGYVIGVVAMSFIAGLAAGAFGSPIPAVILLAVFNAFMAVALWRSAPNASHRAYTLLGRIVAVCLGLGLIGLGLRAVGA